MPETTPASTNAAAGAALRAVRDRNAYAALGRAVSYLMTKPNFRELNFGAWSRTLTGQINRNHYFLVLEGEKMVGFAGWAFVDEELAKAWADGQADFGSADCVSGDCMVVNGWAADNIRVNRFITGEVRRALVGRKAVYAKRFYPGGRVRPFRLGVTEALDGHVGRLAG